MGREGRDRRWERENKKMITKQNEPKRNRTQKKRVSNKGEMGGWAGGGLAKNSSASCARDKGGVAEKGLATGLHYVLEMILLCVMSIMLASRNRENNYRASSLCLALRHKTRTEAPIH